MPFAQAVLPHSEGEKREDRTESLVNSALSWLVYYAGHWTYL